LINKPEHLTESNLNLYFDNAATSFPKAPGVADAMKELLENYGGNAGRSSHKISVKLSELVFETRENLTEIIGGNDSAKLIFQKNVQFI
jgi:selenocysteine lyase/cysteine desulfurase